MMRRWTDRDSEFLRRLYAQGWSDKAIAAMMGFDRQTVRHWRRSLAVGPAKGVPGGKQRPPRTLEQRARIAASMREFWRTRPDRAEMVAKVTGYLPKALKASIQKRKRRRWWPERGTPEYRQYAKLVAIMGPAAARTAWMEGRL